MEDASVSTELKKATKPTRINMLTYGTAPGKSAPFEDEKHFDIDTDYASEMPVIRSVRVWLADRDMPMELFSDEQGELYDGDSYVIALPNEEKGAVFKAFVWHGKASTPTKRGLAATYGCELVVSLGGHCALVTEEQGQESKEFRELIFHDFDEEAYKRLAAGDAAKPLPLKDPFVVAEGVALIDGEPGSRPFAHVEKKAPAPEFYRIILVHHDERVKVGTEVRKKRRAPSPAQAVDGQAAGGGEAAAPAPAPEERPAAGDAGHEASRSKESAEASGDEGDADGAEGDAKKTEEEGKEKAEEARKEAEEREVKALEEYEDVRSRELDETMRTEDTAEEYDPYARRKHALGVRREWFKRNDRYCKVSADALAAAEAEAEADGSDTESAELTSPVTFWLEKVPVSKTELLPQTCCILVADGHVYCWYEKSAALRELAAGRTEKFGAYLHLRHEKDKMAIKLKGLEVAYNIFSEYQNCGSSVVTPEDAEDFAHFWRVLGVLDEKEDGKEGGKAEEKEGGKEDGKEGGNEAGKKGGRKGGKVLGPSDAELSALLAENKRAHDREKDRSVAEMDFEDEAEMEEYDDFFVDQPTFGVLFGAKTVSAVNEDGERVQKRAFAVLKPNDVLPDYAALRSDTCYFFDVDSTLYFWRGARSPLALRRMLAPKLATVFRSRPRPAGARVCVEDEGLESWHFSFLFNIHGEWVPRFAPFSRAADGETVAYNGYALAPPAGDSRRRRAYGRHYAPRFESVARLDARFAEMARQLAYADLPPVVPRLGAGKEPDDGYRSTKVWMMLPPRPVPGDGVFYSEHVYVVLTSCWDQSVFGWSHKLRVWEGNDCDQLLYGMVVKEYLPLIVQQLRRDREFRSVAQEHVVQQREPDDFLDLFRGGITVHRGTPLYDEPRGARLYWVSVRGLCVRTVEVAPRSDLIDPRDCYVLTTGRTVFVWLGAACTKLGRRAAIRVGKRFARDLRLNLVCAEQGIHFAEFWDALEGGYRPAFERAFARTSAPPPPPRPGQTTPAPTLEQHRAAKAFPPVLFTCVLDPVSGEFRVYPRFYDVSYHDLRPGSVTLLDDYTRVFFWRGAESIPSLETDALRLVRHYVAEVSLFRRGAVELRFEEQGRESADFMRLFYDLKRKPAYKVDPRAIGLFKKGLNPILGGLGVPQATSAVSSAAADTAAPAPVAAARVVVDWSKVPSDDVETSKVHADRIARLAAQMEVEYQQEEAKVREFRRQQRRDLRKQFLEEEAEAQRLLEEEEEAERKRLKEEEEEQKRLKEEEEERKRFEEEAQREELEKEEEEETRKEKEHEAEEEQREQDERKEDEEKEKQEEEKEKTDDGNGNEKAKEPESQESKEREKKKRKDKKEKESKHKKDKKDKKAGDDSESKHRHHHHHHRRDDGENGEGSEKKKKKSKDKKKSSE